MTPYNKDDLSVSVVKMLPDVEAGYVIKPDGDIVNVINNSHHKGLGAIAIIDALKNGGRTLDCIDGHLSKSYNWVYRIQTSSLG